MNTSATCYVCKGSDHRTSNCPELTDPLKEGFYQGGSGGGGHSHDDEDERISNAQVRWRTPTHTGYSSLESWQLQLLPCISKDQSIPCL